MPLLKVSYLSVLVLSLQEMMAKVDLQVMRDAVSYRADVSGGRDVSAVTRDARRGGARPAARVLSKLYS